MNAPALETESLGKRYGRRWALSDCRLRLPVGRVAALIGTNGAGKSTLLKLASGLCRPTTGVVRIDGRPVHVGGMGVLPDVGFVAQSAPLYGSFTPEELLRAGLALNPRFDVDIARSRWRELGISGSQRVSTMSGGERAQIALALALAKRPSLLLLDEPLASLDPLARRELLRTLMTAVSETEVTVLLSSHLLAELERVCDWVVVLSNGQVQVAGDVEDLIDSHWWHVDDGSGSARSGANVIDERRAARRTTLLVRSGDAPAPAATKPTLEEVVLAYLGRPDAASLPGPELLGARR